MKNQDSKDRVYTAEEVRTIILAEWGRFLLGAAVLIVIEVLLNRFIHGNAGFAIRLIVGAVGVWLLATPFQNAVNSLAFAHFNKKKRKKDKS